MKWRRWELFSQAGYTFYIVLVFQSLTAVNWNTSWMLSNVLKQEISFSLKHLVQIADTDTLDGAHNYIRHLAAMFPHVRIMSKTQQIHIVMLDRLCFPDLDLLQNVLLLHGTTCISWGMVACSDLKAEPLQRWVASKQYPESAWSLRVIKPQLAGHDFIPATQQGDFSFLRWSQFLQLVHFAWSFSHLNLQARANPMSLGQIHLIALEVKDLSSDMKSTQCAVYGIMVPCFFFCGTKFIAIFTMSRKSALGFCPLKLLHCPHILTCKSAELSAFFPEIILYLSAQQTC